MAKRLHGILKNRAQGPREHSSSDNLLESSSFIPLTSMPSDETVVDKDRDDKYEKRRRKEKRREDDDFVEIGIEDAHHDQTTKRAKIRHTQKVQFPDDLPKAPPTRPSHIRQDSDTTSVHSSSMYLGEDSEREYDWSDEEDLIDEQAKFKNSFTSTKEKRGWGPKRCLSFCCSDFTNLTLIQK
jgi:hypothetical protein